MVSIVRSDDGTRWGLYDPTVKVAKSSDERKWDSDGKTKSKLVWWTNGWRADWKCKNNDYCIKIEIGKKENDKWDEFKPFSEEKILEQLKNLDVSRPELPFFYHDRYSDTEYGESETNGCRKPKYEWDEYIFLLDGMIGNLAMSILFENHGEPWFVGDYFEMPHEESHGLEFTKDGFHICNEDELRLFKSLFIDKMATLIEQKMQEDNKKKAAKEKKAKERGEEGPKGAKRNFERFKTEREAFLAYKQLCDAGKTPIWDEEDGVKAVVAVNFHDWCWLPEKDNKVYKKSQYLSQYLGREYIG